MSGRLLGLLLAMVGLAWSMPTNAAAQLISPGRLAEAHAELEGIRRCTSCHALGQRGISPERCLACHEAIDARIQSDSGYHASLASDSCADCHQDHLGPDFDLLHLDESAFEHAETGYELDLAHTEVEDCRACHNPSQIVDPAVVAFKGERGALDRTFLGLSGECVGCHRDESPHDGQFADRGCADCHDAGDWESAPNFDHEATRYPLEGQHTSVDCVGCHGADPVDAVYRPLPFAACSDCHTDPHSGAFNATCASCHNTAGWDAVSTRDVEARFDHSVTSFALVGAHADADCGACHQRGRAPLTELLRMSYLPGTASARYPQPLADNCRSCHVVQHPAAPDVRWGDCESCHTEVRWAPSSYDASRHAEVDFALTGAHLVTPCVGCHQDPDQGHSVFTLALPNQACVDCHVADDPHDGLYPDMACDQCHVTDAFESARFDHDLVTGGATDGACVTCHSVDDPHAGQFAEQSCDACHQTAAFTISSFDHSETRFPLDGAHAPAPCASCHVEEPAGSGLVRYKPLGTECTDCHGDIQ